MHSIDTKWSTDSQPNISHQTNVKLVLYIANELDKCGRVSAFFFFLCSSRCTSTSSFSCMNFVNKWTQSCRCRHVSVSGVVGICKCHRSVVISRVASHFKWPLLQMCSSSQHVMSNGLHQNRIRWWYIVHNDSRRLTRLYTCTHSQKCKYYMHIILNCEMSYLNEHISEQLEKEPTRVRSERERESICSTGIVYN